MKCPRRLYLIENGENGANGDGALSAIGNNDGGLFSRKVAAVLRERGMLNLVYVVTTRGSVLPSYEHRERTN